MLFILNLTTIVTSGSSVVKHPNTTNESFDICPTDALQLLKRALLIKLWPLPANCALPWTKWQTLIGSVWTFHYTRITVRHLKTYRSFIPFSNRLQKTHLNRKSWLQGNF